MISVIALLVILVSLVLLLAACAVQLYLYIVLPQTSRHKVEAFLSRAIAGPLVHRAGTPENTVAAITRCGQLKAAGIEMDLAFTKDGEAVILHDSTIDRTSNGSGKVSSFTLAELKKLDFGSKSGGSAYFREPIPTLQEAIAKCEELDLLMLLEIKPWRNTRKALQVVEKLFVENPHLYTRIAIISFVPSIVYRFRRQDKNLLVGLLAQTSVLSSIVGDTWFLNGLAMSLLDKALTFSINTWIWKVTGISLLIAHKDDILNGRVVPAEWKSKGVHLIGWTVNDSKEKNHFHYLLNIPYLTDHVEPVKKIV